MENNIPEGRTLGEAFAFLGWTQEQIVEWNQRYDFADGIRVLNEAIQEKKESEAPLRNCLILYALTSGKPPINRDLVYWGIYTFDPGLTDQFRVHVRVEHVQARSLTDALDMAQPLENEAVLNTIFVSEDSQ